MEIIIVLLLFVFGPALIGMAYRALTGATKAAIDTAKGQGSFKENVGVQLHGMGEFEIRLTKEEESSELPFDVIHVEGRGLIPVGHRSNIDFVISVLDDTAENAQPVISTVEDFQEEETIMYQHKTDGGKTNPNEGFLHWVRLGVVIPDLLVPPRGGRRDLMVILRIVDSDEKSKINLGFGQLMKKSLLRTQPL